MARRIEVELTSTKDAETWTWRAAGARQPKGELSASLLYPGAKIGDVVKVEAEFGLDGIEVTEVFAPRAKEERTDLLELIGRPVRDDELVTEIRARKPRGGRQREERKGRPRSEGPGRQRPRREQESKARPTRLKPRRVHRDAALEQVPPEHRPIAEQLLKGGLPAVRSAAKGDPNATQIVSIAEGLAPKFQTAEWRDRADAAMSDIERVDLRDLRSVVVAADKGARDEVTRALAAELRTALDRRVEGDHAAWLADLEKAVAEERTIRALRLTSRPVKAGSPIPVEIAERLAAQTSAAMGPDTPADRWASVLDALAFSPIRAAVKPAHFPVDPDESFLEVVRSVADRVPEIGARYGVDPSEAKAAAKRLRAARKSAGGRKGTSRGRTGGDRRRDRKARDDGPKVDTGPADLLKKPARPRPGTITDDAEADRSPPADQEPPQTEAEAQQPQNQMPSEESPAPEPQADPVAGEEQPAR